MISASILSEHCGRATARHAITRDWPPSMAYTTYPAPPNVSSRRQLPSNWPTICMEGSSCVSSEGIARIISFGLMDWSAVTVHKESGESVQAGTILALVKSYKPRSGWVMRLGHGCPSGELQWVDWAMVVVAVQTRSGSAAEWRVTASLVVVCMWHGWFGLPATACWGRTSDRGSGRKRVGMACMELSCKRVNHSGTLRGTEDVECYIPPCSSKRRRNWWRIWLATTHPTVLTRASWSNDLTGLVEGTGCWQLRQGWCKIEPSVARSCLRVRTLHRGRGLDRGQAMRQGQKKTPDGLSDWVPVGCGRDSPSLITVKGGRIYIVIMAAFFARLAKLSPSGYRRVRTPQSWHGCSAWREPASRSRRHSSSSSSTPQRSTAKRATPLTASFGTVARLVNHAHDTPPGSSCKLTRDWRYCNACTWIAWYRVSLSCRRNWKCCLRVYWPATMRTRSATLSSPSRGVHARKMRWTTAPCLVSTSGYPGERKAGRAILSKPVA